ncbi:MAG: MCE family protein [Bacteroidetes bacterium]|nr:MCE family protein [Bacteroidota bacterium]
MWRRGKENDGANEDKHFPYPAKWITFTDQLSFMSISNETKVGILTLTALTLLFIGFNYLKGKDVFQKQFLVHAVFKELGTLEKSNEVKINGLAVGTVYAKKELDKDVSAIVVTINLIRDIHIPKNSVAYIASELVGSSFIVIERGDSKDLIQPGDTLITRVESGLLGDVKAQLNPTVAKVQEVLNALQTSLNNINATLSPATRADLQASIANLNASTKGISLMLDPETGSLSQTLKNVELITQNLRNNNERITTTLSNAQTASEKLAKLNMQASLDSLSQTLSAVKSTLQKLTDPGGSLGALTADKMLYNKLTDAVLSAEILLDDLRTHPKRYVNLSVFGKKDKTGPLTSPAQKGQKPADTLR